MLKRSTVSGGAFLMSIVIVAGCAGGSIRSASPAYDAQVTDGLGKLRAATRPFQNLDNAVAVGYPRDAAADSAVRTISQR